jgi:hypothetical protein
MMISILYSIKKHNSSSNSSSNNNTIYSVCLVMDPYEVNREREICGPINDTDFNITITNYFIKTLNAFFNMYNHA